MDKLELKHIAPYLPYGLKVSVPQTRTSRIICTLTGLRDNKACVRDKYGVGETIELDAVKPILRPLSAYKNLFGKALIDLNCDLETQIQITEFANQDRSLNSISYDAYNELVKAKVDVFGLIEKGLAADATKLEGGA